MRNCFAPYHIAPVIAPNIKTINKMKRRTDNKLPVHTDVRQGNYDCPDEQVAAHSIGCCSCAWVGMIFSQYIGSILAGGCTNIFYVFNFYTTYITNYFLVKITIP